MGGGGTGLMRKLKVDLGELMFVFEDAAPAWVTLSRTSLGLSAHPAIKTPFVGVLTGKSLA